MESDAAARLHAFNKRWSHENHQPIEVRHADLDQAETNLAYTFPASYRAAVLAVGLPRPTAELWDAIDEASDLPHIGDLLTPSEIVQHVNDWTPLGYPADLIPFASDSSGNLLSFRRADPGGTVYLWDHDFGTVQHVSPSFTELLDMYSSLPGPAK